MDTLLGYVITGIIALAVGYALKFLEPKSRLVYWSPHDFLFELELADQKKGLLYTHTLVIQNLGRKAAEDIEIVHKEPPDYFKLNPALDHTPKKAPTGEHMIRIKSLAPREFFTIEFLSYVTWPVLLYIRCKDGHASLVKMQPVQSLPKWYLNLLRVLFFVGLGTIVYWLIRLGILLLSSSPTHG